MADDREGPKKIRPLTKRNLETGELYFRPDRVENQIKEVLMLSHTEIQERIELKTKSDSRYLLDETIVYLIRESDPDRDSELVNALFGELSVRIARIARSTRHLNPKAEDAEDMAQDAIGYLLERVFEDSNRADFAEVRFGSFISSYLSGKRKVLQNRYNQESKDDPLDKPNEDGFDHEISATHLTAEDAMIICSELNSLPEQTRTAIALIADRYQIESQDPDKMTVSKMMNVSSRSIRIWIKDARERLSDLRGIGR